MKKDLFADIGISNEELKGFIEAIEELGKTKQATDRFKVVSEISQPLKIIADKLGYKLEIQYTETSFVANITTDSVFLVMKDAMKAFAEILSKVDGMSIENNPETNEILIKLVVDKVFKFQR